MKTRFFDALDESIDRVCAGESVTAVLHYYSELTNELAPLLETAVHIQALNPVTQPLPVNLQADRTDFLAQMEQLPEPIVSPTPFIRLKGWIVHTLPWFGTNPNVKKKEPRQMSALLLKAVVMFTIIIGSVGGTAVMAAESLPDSPLYPAKIAYEEAHLYYSVDPTVRAFIHIDLADERLRELERLLMAGKMPEEAQLTRAENHIEAALGLAAEMPQQARTGILSHTQDMIQTQTRTMAQLQVAEDAIPLMDRVQTMLKNTGEIVAAGQQDPQLLRQRNTIKRPDSAPEQPEMMPPTTIITPTTTITETIATPVATPERQGNPCNNEECKPLGDGPIGPAYNGPGPMEEPNPRHGVGPGNGYPGHADPTPQTGPGERNGNPDSDCAKCGSGSQHQLGPQPEEPGHGSGQPGGSTEGIPKGNQNQSGPQNQMPDSSSQPSSPPPADAGNDNRKGNNGNNGNGK